VCEEKPHDPDYSSVTTTTMSVSTHLLKGTNINYLYLEDIIFIMLFEPNLKKFCSFLVGSRVNYNFLDGDEKKSVHLLNDYGYINILDGRVEPTQKIIEVLKCESQL